jgi:protein associated with RNAse G/E
VRQSPLHLHDEPQRLVTVDLDIDVIRRRDGTVEVLDRVEFERHRRELGYPAHLVDDVERAAAEVEAAVRSHQEPFRLEPAVPTSPRIPDEF